MIGESHVVARVIAADNIGKRIDDVHLKLPGFSRLRFQRMRQREAMAGMETAAPVSRC
jgi:hypothetical protein